MISKFKFFKIIKFFHSFRGFDLSSMVRLLFSPLSIVLCSHWLAVSRVLIGLFFSFCFSSFFHFHFFSVCLSGFLGITTWINLALFTWCLWTKLNFYYQWKTQKGRWMFFLCLFVVKKGRDSMNLSIWRIMVMKLSVLGKISP